ncbi:auxin efflux carrier [Ascoidea rubescens DSM 1968]|uniref:Auxin efflux carrier n=1 Tax=Ascoidea rubescens DSM 1968 TaxID=1344418 RepID=A0A1D2VRT0_9ASCO|nr:auxin efflux carrier [Ascoidea rubescens DSM 1968]ODV64299.1 auxin efflux carrier [Ascoidea rubescens DSM 1968]
MIENFSEGLSYFQISYLTFQAVTEILIICLSGYVAAKFNLINSTTQKQISKLNISIFTPALIFIQLAQSLSLKKFLELSIIPIFFTLSSVTSYFCSRIVSSILKLNKSETGFVIANSVFPNSFALPVSLILSLCSTLPNLTWDKLPNDDAAQMASRTVLYLLIYNQLGQILRWSWGYNTLLKKVDNNELYHLDDPNFIPNDSERNLDDALSLDNSIFKGISSSKVPITTTISNDKLNPTESTPLLISSASSSFSSSSLYSTLNKIKTKVLQYMNPPLYAMIAAMIISLLPRVRKILFENNGFLNSTIVLATDQLGALAVPLVLIILGANLYPSNDVPSATPYYNRLVFGSLISRMLLPATILVPLTFLIVKYLSIPNATDPVFLLCAFVLIFCPPALQVSQICQINEIYQKEMAGVLFWSYVIFTLPAIIFAVLLASQALNFLFNILLE